MDRDTLYAGALELALVELLRQRLVQQVQVAAPAAGAEWSQAVPNGVTWELLGVAYRFVTSAVVANRRSSLRIRDGNNLLLGQEDGAAVQAAGATVDYVYAQDQGPPQAIVVNAQAIPLQGVPLLGGTVIGSVTALRDAGDQYSNIALIVREWSTSEVERNAAWLAETFF